jgi:hypothetical protein
VRLRPQALAGAAAADEAGDGTTPDLEGLRDLVERAVTTLISRDDLLP